MCLACVPSPNVIRIIIPRGILGVRSTVVDNIRLQTVGLSVRCFRLRSSKIEGRCVDFRRSTIDVTKMDDRCADLRRSMVVVSTLED